MPETQCFPTLSRFPLKGGVSSKLGKSTTGRRDSGGTGTGGGGPTCLPVPLLPPPQRSSPPPAKSSVPLRGERAFGCGGRGSRREGGAKEGAITLLVSLNDGSPVSVHKFLAPSYVHKFLCMRELKVPPPPAEEKPIHFGGRHSGVLFVEINLFAAQAGLELAV